MNPVCIVSGEDDINDVYLGEAIWLWCPACDHLARLPVNRTEGVSWTWDGNREAPTLSPSILQHASGTMPTCHSFLENGVWRFLSDCTHAMAGMEVPMVPLPDWIIDQT